MTLYEYLRQLQVKQRKLKCPWYDIRVCVSPTWHRKYWRHAGQQHYECEVCKRLGAA